jgi:hypothetical protein
MHSTLKLRASKCTMHIMHTIFNKKHEKKKDIEYFDNGMSLKLKVKKNLPRRPTIGLTKINIDKKLQTPICRVLTQTCNSKEDNCHQLDSNVKIMILQDQGSSSK